MTLGNKIAHAFVASAILVGVPAAAVVARAIAG